MKYLFFDTETTGLPLNWKAPVTMVDNWPRVFQLAWILADEQGRELRRHKYVISPDGWTLPEKPFWLDKGYTTEYCNIFGMPIETALEILFPDYRQADYLVAHNMEFDYNVLGAEIIRAKYTVDHATNKAARICTKVHSTQFCRLPGGFKGQYKWPTLEELYVTLFKQPIQDAHDALGDVVTLKNCFFELVRLGVINPQAKTPCTMKRTAFFITWTNRGKIMYVMTETIAANSEIMVELTSKIEEAKEYWTKQDAEGAIPRIRNPFGRQYRAIAVQVWHKKKYIYSLAEKLR